MDIARVEVYLDNQDKPYAVLEQAPFTLELDPTGMEEGTHYLIAVTHYRDGSVDHHEYVFEVARRGPVYAGHIARAPIMAPIEVRMVDSVELEAPTKPDLLRYAVFPVLLFLLFAGVTTWLAFYGENALPGGALAAGGQVASTNPPGTPTPLSGNGEAIYQQLCASCHQPDGRGQPPTFPALAQNPKLADAEYVIKTVLNGKPGTAMPPFGRRLDDAGVAAVVNHIRNAWGNRFGTVTPEEVAQLR